MADDALDEGIDIAPRQPVERQRAYVRPSDPGRAELRPESNEYQKPSADCQINHPAEQFEAGRIGPMRIFENRQHRIGLRKRLELRSKSLQRLLTTELRLNLNWRIPSIIGQRQQFGNQGRML